MRKEPMFSIRMYMVNIILPLSLVLSLILVFVQVWEVRSVVDKNGLKANRFLYEPLNLILNDDQSTISKTPEWLTLVMLEDGTIRHPDQIYYEDVLNQFKFEYSQMELKNWMSLFVLRMPDSETIIKFTYNGLEGLCLYNSSYLPLKLRVLQNPYSMGITFFIAMLFFAMGSVLMNSHHRSIQSLVQAAQRIKKMDFDSPIAEGRLNEFSAVFDAFEDMRVEIKGKRQKGAVLLASVTHDLKTPLTSMRVYLEALKDGIITSPEEGLDAIEKILAKAGMLEERIDELLYIFRGLTSSWMIEESVDDTEDWLNELTLLFREESLLHSRQYEQKIKLAKNIRLKGNRKLLSRGIHNLLDNAIRYTEKDDKILFTANYKRAGHYLFLTLEDSGSGVAEEDQEKIFEMFYRKDQGRNSRGMGIGLSSIRFILEEYGGDIQYKKSKLGGACFEVKLPLA